MDSDKSEEALDIELTDVNAEDTNGRMSVPAGESSDSAADYATTKGHPLPSAVGSSWPQSSKKPFLERSFGAVFGGKAWVKVWRRVELGLLVALIVVVWGLLLLPVVFYHLPEDKVRSKISVASIPATDV